MNTETQKIISEILIHKTVLSSTKIKEVTNDIEAGLNLSLQGKGFLISKGDEVNSILVAALRSLNEEQKIALRDALIERTPAIENKVSDVSAEQFFEDNATSDLGYRYLTKESFLEYASKVNPAPKVNYAREGLAQISYCNSLAQAQAYAEKYLKLDKENQFLPIEEGKEAIEFGIFLMFSDESGEYQRRHRIYPAMDGSDNIKFKEQVKQIYQLFKNNNHG